MVRPLLILFLLATSFYGVRAQGDISKMLDKSLLIYDENPAESFALCEAAERKAIATDDHSMDGDISLCKARYLILIASFDQASSELNKAIVFFQEKEDDYNLSKAYSLKGVLLHKMGDNQGSHNLQLKVLNIDRRIGNQFGIIQSLQNLSLDYKRLGDIDSMKVCLDELSEMTDEFDEKDFYYYYQNWGVYYIEISDYPRAIQHFEKALKVSEEQKMTDSKATGLMFLSKAHRLNGDLQRADDFGRQSYEFSQENNLIYETSEALIEWMEAKKELGDYKGAFDLQNKWVKVDKEIYDLEKIKKVKSIEGQLDILEKEKEIAEGQVALKEANLKGEKERTRNAWLTGVVLIVVVLLFFTIFIYVRTRKLNQTIKEQKEEVELKSLRLEEALKSIHDSLEYSKMIQGSMLPPRSDFQKAFSEHFILYKPKDIVSGDFYWFHQFEDRIVVAVADCTGHGVPGAMVSMVCHEALNKILLEKKETDPGRILDGVRDIIVQTFKRNEHSMSDGMDIALISIQGNKLKYAGAYNNLWVFRNKQAALPEATEMKRITALEQCGLIELKASKQPVGHFHQMNSFTTQELDLGEEDKIYLMSDGYADQFGGDKGKKLKASNLKTILANAYHLKLEDQETHLNNIFNEWKGELEQLDDICLMGLKV